VQRDSLSVVSYNIHSCRSAKFQPSLDEVVRVIDDADADVVALQEVDVNCPRTERIHQAEELGRRLKMTPHFFRLVDWSRFHSPHESNGLYGLAFLARQTISLRDFKHIHLPVLSPLSEPRGVFQLQLEWQGKALSILNTHLSVQRRENLLQMEAVRELVQQICSREGDCLLVGDLNNATARTRGIRRLRTVMAECVPIGSPRSTFPSRFPMLQLDRMFTGGGLAPRPSRVLASPAARKASDHLPIRVELKL